MQNDPLNSIYLISVNGTKSKSLQIDINLCAKFNAFFTECSILHISARLLVPITYLSGINKDHFQHRSKVISCQLLKTRKLRVSSRVIGISTQENEETKNRSTYLLFDALVISTLRKKIQPLRIQESRCLLDILHPHRALRSCLPKFSKRRYVQFLSSTV